MNKRSLFVRTFVLATFLASMSVSGGAEPTGPTEPNALFQFYVTDDCGDLTCFSLELPGNTVIVAPPMLVDLDGDWETEIIIGTSRFIAVFERDGSLCESFRPAFVPNCAAVAAVNVDGRGITEIIAQAGRFLWVFDCDGSLRSFLPIGHPRTELVPFSGFVDDGYGSFEPSNIRFGANNGSQNHGGGGGPLIDPVLRVDIEFPREVTSFFGPIYVDGSGPSSPESPDYGPWPHSRNYAGSNSGGSISSGSLNFSTD